MTALSRDRCPRCSGRLVPNLDGDETCFLCGCVVYENSYLPGLPETSGVTGLDAAPKRRRASPRKPAQQQRLMELADGAKARLTSVENIQGWVDKLDPAIDAFLNQLMPRLAKAEKLEWMEGEISRAQWKGAMERFEARDIVLSALMTTPDSRETWTKARGGLLRRFPDLGRRSASSADVAAINAAFLNMCHAWKDHKSADAEYPRYWQAATRTIKKMFNRGQTGSRLRRQLNVEEIVFNYLWFGTPITDSALQQHEAKVKHADWDSALSALDHALRRVPAARTLEDLIKAAHKNVGGSGSGSYVDSKYQAFRRLIYRHTNQADRKYLMTVEKEPYEPEVIYVGKNLSSSGLVEKFRQLGYEVRDLRDLD